MKPTGNWKFRKETDILARFKEMGWIPPSEAKSEIIRSSNQKGWEPGWVGKVIGHRAQQHKPLEAPGSRSSDPRSED